MPDVMSKHALGRGAAARVDEHRNAAHRAVGGSGASGVVSERGHWSCAVSGEPRSGGEAHDRELFRA